MPEATPPKPASVRAALTADTDQALAWTREARKKLSPADPEAKLFLRASARLAETLRDEFPGLLIGRVLMSASQSMEALEERLARQGVSGGTGTLFSVLALAAEQLAREEAEARNA